MTHAPADQEMPLDRVSGPAPGPLGGLTPHLTIPARGAAAAINFYIIAFGATVLDRRMADDGERIALARIRINGGDLLLSDEFPERDGLVNIRPVGVTLHLQATDPDGLWTRAMLGGAEPVLDMEEHATGGRYGQLRDPFGHSWTIGG